LITEHSLGRWTLVLSVGMAAVSALAVEPALGPPERSAGDSVAWAIPGVLAMLVTLLWIRRRHERRQQEVSLLLAALVLATLFVVPALFSAGRELIAGDGQLLESILLQGLRNLTLGLGALAARPAFGRLTALTSLFMMLVATTLTDGLVVASLGGCFAVMGVLWLMAEYWRRLPSEALPTRSTAGRGVSHGLRLIVGLVVLSMIGVLAGAMSIAPSGGFVTLAGLLPSSGGNDDMDEEAKSGVGDGPNEVEGRNDPKSVGFTQSEIYLDTDKPSLYDAFNDMYGEPYNKTKSERAMAVAPSQVKEQGEIPKENLKAGREFSNVRKSPRLRHGLEDRSADALVYVQGKTPLHLRLTAYDRLENDAWIEAPQSNAYCPIVSEGSKSSWLRLDWPILPFMSGIVKHKIKMANLDTSVVPAPALLDRFRVGSVNRRDFFGWSQDQLLMMDGRTIPAGTVVEIESWTIFNRRLRELDFAEAAPYASAVYKAAPPNGPIADLARRWIAEAGVGRGWEQVEALVSRLRAHAQHDRSAVTPEGCPDSLAHFLLDARRGPDYLFAGSAAMMLRSLGYPTRVVSGLYVRPDRYDRWKRHVAVGADDVHFWAEVLVSPGLWIPIEPTPGFELMPPVLSPGQWLEEQSRALWAWVTRNGAGIGMMFLAVALVATYRARLADGARSVAWRILAPCRTPRQQILGALDLIERRARWAGRARPEWCTPSSWYSHAISAAPDDAAMALADFLRLADWSLYAPSSFIAAPTGFDHCTRALRHWTTGRFRRAGSDSGNLTREDSVS
jgi:protein-glutamine gamma-glutamyltransferase